MEPFSIKDNATIAAIATPPGKGGVAIIRISGPRSIEIVSKAWKGRDLREGKSHSVHLGKYLSVDGKILDECVASIFIAPASFTGENTVELGLHGSEWIQREVLNDLVKRGARIANPGEFTQRAFLNGKIDLAQAEGVADLISSSSRAAHQMACQQTSGMFSKEFKNLRDKLIEFASLIELELDFSEEEVEFADRTKLLALCDEIIRRIEGLTRTYANGNALKNGVPVVIAGIPNAGKSSLLNLFLGNEKAIVTNIPGTTRDLVEDTVEIDGILYRFIDTAGLRETDDPVEKIGVERSRLMLEKASIVIWVIDLSASLDHQLEEYNTFKTQNPEIRTVLLYNKADLISGNPDSLHQEGILFSTRTLQGEKELLATLQKLAKNDTDPEKDLIVTNARHYEALTNASKTLQSAKEALQSNMSGELVAQDIRETLHHLGLITGEISTPTLLSSIFSSFCIGK